MFRRLIPDPFLLFLIGTVALATILPARGAFAIVVGHLATVTIVLLFFFHGARLAREQVVAGLVHWRLHLAILGVTFVAFPAAGFALVRSWPGLLPADLWLGVLFLCALPSTVQSAIAFVSIARGNVAAAIASASASQMLGVFLTPLLMGLLADTHGNVGWSGIGKVAAQILLPFVAGHLARPLVGSWVARHRTLVGVTDRATILIAVYGAFSAAVIEGLWARVPPTTLGLVLAVDAALLAFGLGAAWAVGRAGGFAREDRIALLFCGTKKSIVQGVPMAKVLFPASQAGIVLLPIMLFHQIQLMACAVIARRLRRVRPMMRPPDLA